VFLVSSRTSQTPSFPSLLPGSPFSSCFRLPSPQNLTAGVAPMVPAPGAAHFWSAPSTRTRSAHPRLLERLHLPARATPRPR
jgi:hypothetical protein